MVDKRQNAIRYFCCWTHLSIEVLREFFGLGQEQLGSDLNEELGSSKESERYVMVLDVLQVLSYNEFGMSGSFMRYCGLMITLLI